MKKLLLTILLVVGVTAVAISQTLVQSGTWKANSTTTTSYTLHENQGERSVVISVPFLKPFETKPDVILTVNKLDAEALTNVRYSVKALTVTRDGFTIQVVTWAETKLYGISGYWMAHAD
ncbi:MAG: hypothetical protein HKM87_04975 [Ignavibacteriaceae bacterium]|nr:hypothetical protein [Ignavibacteriaceae bacterium]